MWVIKVLWTFLWEVFMTKEATFKEAYKKDRRRVFLFIYSVILTVMVILVTKRMINIADEFVEFKQTHAQSVSVAREQANGIIDTAVAQTASEHLYAEEDLLRDNITTKQEVIGTQGGVVVPKETIASGTQTASTIEASGPYNRRDALLKEFERIR